MMIVRNCFVAKPGQASKLAAQLKDMGTTNPLPGFRVLTDMTGDFNRVIMEFSIDSLSEIEARMQQYMTDPAIREKMKGYTELWSTGCREIFKVM